MQRLHSYHHPLHTRNKYTSNIAEKGVSWIMSSCHPQNNLLSKQVRFLILTLQKRKQGLRWPSDSVPVASRAEQDVMSVSSESSRLSAHCPITWFPFHAVLLTAWRMEINCILTKGNSYEVWLIGGGVIFLSKIQQFYYKLECWCYDSKKCVCGGGGATFYAFYASEFLILCPSTSLPTNSLLSLTIFDSIVESFFLPSLLHA